MSHEETLNFSLFYSLILYTILKLDIIEGLVIIWSNCLCLTFSNARLSYIFIFFCFIKYNIVRWSNPPLPDDAKMWLVIFSNVIYRSFKLVQTDWDFPGWSVLLPLDVVRGHLVPPRRWEQVPWIFCVTVKRRQRHPVNDVDEEGEDEETDDAADQRHDDIEHDNIRSWPWLTWWHFLLLQENKLSQHSSSEAPRERANFLVKYSTLSKFKIYHEITKYILSFLFILGVSEKTPVKKL